ncbi:hypothetical protein DFH27DRAFT_640048 [Peziza echinospora]|nr:hypothetical protein DFH27DRAFT_640048 [Peziza echinospora]
MSILMVSWVRDTAASLKRRGVVCPRAEWRGFQAGDRTRASSMREGDETEAEIVSFPYPRRGSREPLRGAGHETSRDSLFPSRDSREQAAMYLIRQDEMWFECYDPERTRSETRKRWAGDSLGLETVPWFGLLAWCAIGLHVRPAARLSSARSKALSPSVGEAAAARPMDARTPHQTPAAHTVPRLPRHLSVHHLHHPPSKRTSRYHAHTHTGNPLRRLRRRPAQGETASAFTPSQK